MSSSSASVYPKSDVENTYGVSSAVETVLSEAVGVSLTPVTVNIKVAVSVAVPSETV